MGYRSTHFRIEELVSKKTFDRFGERCWEFLNPKILMTLDTMHDEFGTVKVNDWVFGGILQNCGLRDMYSAVIGADFSIHKLGGAMDMHPAQVAPQEMYARILARPDRFPYLTCMENITSTPTWVHSDCRNHGQPQQIWIVNP